MVTKDKQWWTFEVLGPSMIYNRFNREISCHRITKPVKSFALPPATKPVSHLPYPLPPNQSVICLAPCHQTSQSFDLPSTTVSPHHHITASPHHCITTSLHHHATASPHHCVSQSFALPPATKPVSHLPCPLPLHHHITTSLHHHVTASPCHCITTSLC